MVYKALLTLIAIGLFALVGAVAFDRDTEPVTAQTTSPQPYYTEQEALGFVRGWLSEQRPSSAMTGISSCLGVLERAHPAWSAIWDGGHWQVRAATPSVSYRYEFWERTWKVVNPNNDC